MTDDVNLAREVARTNLKATVVSALLGCAGVVLAAWIGTTVGRNRAQDAAKTTEARQDTQLADKDKLIAQLRSENQGLRQQLASSSGGVVGGGPVPANATSPAQNTQRNEEFEFTLQRCIHQRDSVNCTFTVVAEHRDNRVILWGSSRLIDDAGKEWLASAISLAGRDHRVERYTAVDNDLVRGVVISGTITFEGPSATLKATPLIEFVAVGGNVQFRSVPIT